MTATSTAFILSGIAFSWEMVFLGGFLLSGLIYGFTVGRDRAITVLLSTYVALAIVTNAPMLTQLSVALGLQQSPWLMLFWFFGCFAVIFVVLWRSALLRSLGSSRGQWWETLLFSMLQIGLVVSIVLYLVPKDIQKGLSFVTLELFAQDSGRVFWLIAPLVFLGILGRSSEGDTMDLE